MSSPNTGYLPVWAICRENIQSNPLWAQTRSSPSLEIQTHAVFPPRVSAETTENPSRRHGDTLPVCPRRPSVDLPLLTLLSVRINAPHERCGRMRLAHTPGSLSPDWLNTAVNHASAREPGSPVAPSVCHLTFGVNILTLLSRKHTTAECLKSFFLY